MSIRRLNLRDSFPQPSGNLPGVGAWIPVGKRLPELEDHMGSLESALVLGLMPTGTPNVVYMCADKTWREYWDEQRTPHPTHWMPLPEPPK